MAPKFCFIDTETTGVDVAQHGLIQIAGILSERNGEGRFVELDRFNMKMQPFALDKIDGSALQVNGVTVEMFAPTEAYGSTPESQHKELVALLGERISKFDKRDKAFFVGYNARFDYDFVRRWFEKCGDKYFGSWFWYPPIDVMNMAALHLLNRRLDVSNFKLATVAEVLGVKPEGELHDAWTDIQLTQEIFNKLYNPTEATQ